MGLPSRAEVLAYMARTGHGAAETVEHFVPGVQGKERAALERRVRVWKHRQKASPGRQDAANRDEPAGPPSRPVVVEDRHREPGKLDRVAFLEWQLERLVAVYDAVLADGLVGRAAAIDARISEVRQHLDDARGEAGRVVTLERNPAAVAEEVQRRAKRIAELAARAREREL